MSDLTSNAQVCNGIVFNQDIDLISFTFFGYNISPPNAGADDFTLSTAASINTVIITAIDFVDQVSPELHVSFYTDAGGELGTEISTQVIPAGGTCYNYPPAPWNTSVHYQISIPISTVNLSPGTYWLKVQTGPVANFIDGLFWQTTNAATGAPAKWIGTTTSQPTGGFAFALCGGSSNCGSSCPDLTSAPGEVQITNSVCTLECSITDGMISAPLIVCPEGSTLEYSVNNGEWTTTLPDYNASMASQQIQTRCLCDTDSEVSSPASAGISTMPAVCDQTLEINCVNGSVVFNGQQSISLVAASLVNINSACPIKNISANPAFINCAQVGETVPVLITVTNVNDIVSTCMSNVTVTGLPCSWAQSLNGIGCEGGNEVNFNTSSGVWTNTSTNCYYDQPFTSDAIGFAQSTLCGNGSITAQVTGINGLGWAGVVMRESNTPGAKKAQLMTNLSNLSRREFRTITNGQSYPQQFLSLNRYWLRVTRSGSQFTMHVSSNGTNWFPAGSQIIPMSNCIVFGLATTNYSANSTVIATFANVSTTGNTQVPSGSNPVISNASILKDIEVYPNPTSGELNINLTQYQGRDISIEVYSLQGKLLKLSEQTEVIASIQQLDMSGLTPGIYLIRVKSKGLPYVTKRVIKQ
ncbi:MAG: T9SS type A sorting domain-containing protein [Saprospiraceae bacterium]|nr:T9SS type A sorting domain-containing protein [Saprospiraceae bacterium]